MGAKRFAGCTRLKTVRLHFGLTKIDGYAFDGCACLSRLPLPSMPLSAIGINVFFGCRSFLVQKDDRAYALPIPTSKYPHRDDEASIVLPEFLPRKKLDAKWEI